MKQHGILLSKLGNDILNQIYMVREEVRDEDGSRLVTGVTAHKNAFDAISKAIELEGEGTDFSLLNSSGVGISDDTTEELRRAVVVLSEFTDIVEWPHNSEAFGTKDPTVMVWQQGLSKLGG